LRWVFDRLLCLRPSQTEYRDRLRPSPGKARGGHRPRIYPENLQFEVDGSTPSYHAAMAILSPPLRGKVKVSPDGPQVDVGITRWSRNIEPLFRSKYTVRHYTMM